MPRVVKTALTCALATTAVVWSSAVAQAAAPTNDDFSSATAISGVPFTDESSSTLEATRVVQDPGCGDGGTIWYSFTSPSNMYLEANTIFSGFDTMLGVYTGEPGNFTELGCDDDSGGSATSAVGFQASAGTTYHFMVTNYYGVPGGNIVFNLLETPPPPPPLTSVVVDPTTATVNGRGVVTVNGTVVCDQPGQAYVAVYGSQSNRRFTARGDGATETQCATTPTTWSVTFRSYTGASFVPGSLSAEYYASAAGGRGYADTSGSETMRLRGIR